MRYQGDQDYVQAILDTCKAQPQGFNTPETEKGRELVVDCSWGVFDWEQLLLNSW